MLRLIAVEIYRDTMFANSHTILSEIKTIIQDYNPSFFGHFTKPKSVMTSRLQDFYSYMRYHLKISSLKHISLLKMQKK